MEERHLSRSSAVCSPVSGLLPNAFRDICRVVLKRFFGLQGNTFLAVDRRAAVSWAAVGLACRLHDLPIVAGSESGLCSCCAMGLPARARTSVSGIRSCDLMFRSFLRQNCVEMVRFLGTALIHCSRFTRIEQRNEYYCPVHVDLQLCLWTNASSVPDVGVFSAEGCAGFCISDIYLVVDGGILGQCAVKAGEPTHRIQSLAF